MSEKNKSKDSKKWLISRLKTSGSKRRRLPALDYIRPTDKIDDPEETLLPFHESMSGKEWFYKRRINTDLLKRFLRRQIGRPWDEVYSEIIERIPEKLFDYKDCIYWYVADKVKIVEERLIDLRDSRSIIVEIPAQPSYARNSKYIDFYVDPDTGILEKVKDFPTRKVTKKMTKKELVAFREKEREAALARKKEKRLTAEKKEALDQILSEKKLRKGGEEW